MFKNMFGGKSWYKSVTAWGLILGGAVVSAFQAGLIPEKYAIVGGVASWIVAQLGQRKAATAPNSG